MKNRMILLLISVIALSTSCKKEPESEAAPKYPTDGLVSYFNFDDNLKDQLGNTPDGTNYGDATFTVGKAGKAITLNGTNQYVEFGRKTYKNGNSISIALWFNRSTTPSTGIYFVVCSDFGVFTTDVTAGLAISVPGTNNAKGAITQNNWFHLVGTYDGTNIKAYINGELIETKNHPGNIYDADRTLTIGSFNSGFWGGSVDDLFIYNRVLSQEEINQLYTYH